MTAIHPLSLSLRAGATTALLGPSGSGKSTLLRLLNGLIQPDTGKVEFQGGQLNRHSRLRMGYVIQEGGLFPHLTVRQNLALQSEFLGKGIAETSSRVASLGELARFPKEALDRYPRELSGGQRQRVALMRALMLDPDVLLLDEPLGALDPMIRRQLQIDLKEIFSRLGKTVILVTHDVGEAGFLAQEILLLHEGRLAQRGSLLDLVERPASPFVTDFINSQRSPLESLGGNA